MIKSFKVMLYPTKEQQDKIIKFCNASRFSYNWALSLEKENYEQGNKFINGYDLTKLFTQFKKQDGNEWLKEISARATKNAIMNCAKAYENFFKHKYGFPKFKVKGRCKMSCATHEGTTIIEPKRIRLEKLGYVKCHNNNIPNGTLYNPTIHYDGINYWFIVSVEAVHEKSENPKSEPIGIDLGLKTLAVCSNNITLKKPNIKKLQKRLKRQQRRASKYYKVMIDYCNQTKTKFNTLHKSKNLLKLERQIKLTYIRINNILTTNIHEFTTKLIKLNPEAIVIEDLDVVGMRKNKHLSKAINEAKFAEIRRQLEYKCLWNNVKLIIADRWYPSSKTCNVCGNIKKKLSLSERVYKCECCNSIIDRDVNAAINLKNLA